MADDDASGLTVLKQPTDHLAYMTAHLAGADVPAVAPRGWPSDVEPAGTCVVCLPSDLPSLELLIPSLTDHNLKAQSRMPIDMIFQGWSMSLFQAKQQWSSIPHLAEMHRCRGQHGQVDGFQRPPFREQLDDVGVGSLIPLNITMSLKATIAVSGTSAASKPSDLLAPPQQARDDLILDDARQREIRCVPDDRFREGGEEACRLVAANCSPAGRFADQMFVSNSNSSLAADYSGGAQRRCTKAPLTV